MSCGHDLLERSFLRKKLLDSICHPLTHHSLFFVCSYYFSCDPLSLRLSSSPSPRITNCPVNFNFRRQEILDSMAKNKSKGRRGSDAESVTSTTSSSSRPASTGPIPPGSPRSPANGSNPKRKPSTSLLSRVSHNV